MAEPWADTGTNTGRLMLALAGLPMWSATNPQTYPRRSNPRQGSMKKGQQTAPAGATLQELADSYDGTIDHAPRNQHRLTHVFHKKAYAAKAKGH